ncbi:hypothetical protein [Mycolicibacterium aichiense]|nr:hypothetical protein [Mycolicibacterium aichiense]
MLGTAALERNMPCVYCNLTSSARSRNAKLPDTREALGISVMGSVMRVEADVMYVMSGIVYTRDELAAAIEAEAATLPPETWRSGEWNLADYMIEAEQVGIINRIYLDDDVDDYA